MLPVDRYAAIARWYDTATGRALALARGAILDLCRDEAIARIVDIGCGTGMLAAELAASGFEVVAVDTSPAMLAIARERLPGPVSTAMAAIPLSFTDRAFDAAILALVLHETETDPGALLREALRVAGRVFVLEWKMPERNLDYIMHPLVHAVERMAGKAHYAAFRAYGRRGWLRGVAADAGAIVIHERLLYMGTMTLAVVIPDRSGF